MQSTKSLVESSGFSYTHVTAGAITCIEQNGIYQKAIQLQFISPPSIIDEIARHSIGTIALTRSVDGKGLMIFAVSNQYRLDNNFQKVIAYWFTTFNPDNRHELIVTRENVSCRIQTLSDLLI